MSTYDIHPKVSYGQFKFAILQVPHLETRSIGKQFWKPRIWKRKWNREEIDTVINLAVIDQIFVLGVDISAVVLVSGSHNFKMDSVIVTILTEEVSAGDMSTLCYF